MPERIKPVLFLNKLDRLFFELAMDLEAAYQSLRRTIESVNVIIATNTGIGSLMGDVSVWPQNASVAFGSASS